MDAARANLWDFIIIIINIIIIGKENGFKLVRDIQSNAIRLLLLILNYNITCTIIILGASSEHYNISYESGCTSTRSIY